jgi:hypothetical protein
MSTIIDSLIVTLGLDAKGMDQKAPASTKKLKDLQDQSKKTEGEVKNLGKTADESGSKFETVTKAVAGFLALVGGTMAIRSFINDQIEMNAELERMSKNLGINVSTLSAWGNAVEEVGGNASGLQGTMDMLSKSQTELRLTGQSSLIPYFSALGVSLADVHGKARPVDDILLDLSGRFSKMDRTTANNMGRMMGIDPDTMNLLLMGRKELELTIARQKEHNAVTAKQAEQAVKLQKAIVDTKQTFSALGRTLLEQATPALEWLVGVMQRVGDWAQKNSQFVGDFAKVLGVVAIGVGAIALASSPLALITAGVLALAAGIALLWQDYQTWKRGGDSFVPWGKWEPEIKAATKGLNLLKEAMEGVGHAYEKYYEKLTGNKFSLRNLAQDARSIFGQEKVDNPAAIAGRTSNAGGISSIARAQAERVAKMTGGNADLIYAQWEHETGGFKNRGATSLNNFAGVNVPGGKGQDYRKFDSADQFGNYFAYLMRPGGRYSGLASAQTADQYAHVLKSGGYMGDSESNYSKDMQHWLGVPGASSTVAGAPSGGGSGRGSSTTDASVKIDKIEVHTQATDAKGIATDMGNAMDFLFTSQANAGLF